MTQRRAYTYVVLRYRHDPLSGEFANVGVVVCEPESSFIDAQVKRAIGRVTKMFPDARGSELRSVLRGIENRFKRLARREENSLFAPLLDAGTAARQVLPDDDSSFTWGPVGSGVTDDPNATLNKLFARFVTRHDERHTRHRDDEAVWKPVRDLLAERDLAHRLAPKTIRTSEMGMEFEHAWKNGKWHCYQPLSFDLSSHDSIEQKAARWAGVMVALQEAKDDFRPIFLVGSPANNELRPAYAAALRLLAKSPCEPEIVEESHAESLVNRIETEIRASEAGAHN